MEKLFSEVKVFTEGMLVKGRILEVRTNEVLVDIGYKSEGSISLSEFDEPEAVKAGDEIEVLLENLEDDDGMVVLSFARAEQKKNWDRIVTICTEGGTIDGKVRGKVKGGLMVNIGVDAFLPASQIDVIPPRNLDEYMGKTFKFKVVKINQERHNIVLSRRELIEQEREDKRAHVAVEYASWTDSLRRGKEPHGFRRVYRSRRSRRPVAHHGHELGSHQSSFRVAQGWRDD